MPVDNVLKFYVLGLKKVISAASADIERIQHELEQSRKSLENSTDPVTIWTTGISIASIQSESVSQLSVPEVVSLMKNASEPQPTKKEKPACVPNPAVLRKAVTFNPQVQAVAIERASESSAMEICAPENPATRAPETPQTATKVRGMLSVWEEKIQRVTTPHYGKTPMSVSNDPAAQSNVAGWKRKEPEAEEAKVLIPIPESPDLNTSFDGPILEIPDDLLAELETLDPAQREKRISVLKLEAEERRKSEGKPVEPPKPVEEPVQPQSLTGRVAAALKLFKGTTVPKRDFGIVSFAPSKVYSHKNDTKPLTAISMDMGIDGVAMEDEPPKKKPDEEPIKFYDAKENGVLDVEFEDDSEEEQIDPNTSILHAAEAAKEVAEEEAAVEEMEKSVWLADIEEIKIVSTPAKGRAEPNADWSAVSQKMNLSCHLTPVVPGRRSCIVAKPKMIPLGPKFSEDQYEVTDKDTDSENEPSPNTRSRKHIPAWCTNWRQKAIAQIAVDPESIFGSSAPKCDLDVIFTEKNYRSMGLSRPKRVRGSSGNWTFDKLTQEEVDRYRAKLGQVVEADGVFVDY